ncbi:MAG: AAA family ATPase [Clostridia bacterium]|nr:AAA family ATPase [Clostridia bacterium]
MSIRKIVITGGPCAGKSTALITLKKHYEELGMRVLVINETATELIMSGVAPWTCESNLEYQRCQLKLQLEKERVYEQAARGMKDEEILIICDRGIMDNLAYMSPEEFSTILEEEGISYIDARDRYDGVFFLVTAARGAERFFTLANNSARTETVEQAIALDVKTVRAWIGHPHLRVIDNSTDFMNKMKRLLNETDAFLGIPEPLEIERKFLVEYPDIEKLKYDPDCTPVSIVQTYAETEDMDRFRLRKRGDGEDSIYILTRKTKITEVKRIEEERRITKEEYEGYLSDPGLKKKQIEKTRYLILYKDRYFELDVFPYWNDRALLEIELNEEGETFEIPTFLKIVREVTEEEEYKNSVIAETYGKKIGV